MEQSRTGIDPSREHAPAPTAEPTPTSSPLPRAMFEETDHFTAGPGLAMTKSQARGGLAGALLGLFAGALVGLVIGIVFFDGDAGRLVSVVATAVAGLVAGGVAGGIVRPMQKGGHPRRHLDLDHLVNHQGRIALLISNYSSPNGFIATSSRRCDRK